MFKAQGLETAPPEAARRERGAASASRRQGCQPACPADERWAPRWAILLSLSASLLLWGVIAILIF
jgi:hypothetical protein